MPLNNNSSFNNHTSTSELIEGILTQCNRHIKESHPCLHWKSTVPSQSVTLILDMTQIVALSHKDHSIFVAFCPAIQLLTVNLLLGRGEDSDPNLKHHQVKFIGWEVSCFKIASAHHCNIAQQLQNHYSTLCSKKWDNHKIQWRAEFTTLCNRSKKRENSVKQQRIEQQKAALPWAFH